MPADDRFHALDAVRAFALLLGIVFHAAESFVPGIPEWAVADNSPSMTLAVIFYVSHIFRMPLFFLMAGFFGHMVYHRRGYECFVRDRIKRILIPLVAGWIVLYPAIVYIWIWGAQKAGGATLPAEVRHLPAWMLTIGAFWTGEVFNGGINLAHLWFLYYLLLFYGIVLVVRWCFVSWLDREGGIRLWIDRRLRTLLGRIWAPVVLAIPVAVCLYCGVGWFGVHTPDRSLVPELPTVVAYGTFVGLGSLLHRQVDLLPIWTDRWLCNLAFAILLTIATLVTTGRLADSPGIVPGWMRPAYAAAYSLAMWSWVSGIVGLFLRYFSGPSAARRYVADSSYWLYLTHLPLVAFLQVAVGHAPWHWSLKFPLILATAFPLLFVSYHYLVRSTFIGAILNGHRRTR